MSSSSPRQRSNYLTNTIIPLSPHLKCPVYELFSSFFLNGGVCAFIRSDVQTSRLPQFYFLSPGFQLISLKISLPNTSKFICCLTFYLNQLTQSLFILLALKLSSLVLLLSTVQTGLHTPYISLALLAVMQRPLPFLRTVTINIRAHTYP